MEKVSCLMITLDRFDGFVSSFRCYCNQTYENKELVIVTDGESQYQQRLQRHIDESGRSDVRLITLKERLPLGALRNISLDAATGDLICQWDDDDLYHSARLEEQVKDMLQKSADISYLTEQLQLFVNDKILYWCDWTKCKDPFDSMIPGTLLARKNSLPYYKPEMKNAEDAILRGELIAAGASITTLSGKGYLYIYTFHGKNTFGLIHHDSITTWAGLNVNELRERASVIEYALGDYLLDTPVSIVDKYTNIIFQWDGKRLIPHRSSLFSHIRCIYRTLVKIMAIRQARRRQDEVANLS